MQPDAQILKFINEFKSSNPKALENVFSNGYCWHFATLLSQLFPNGTVCEAYPCNHIVYVKESVAYDINGVTTVKYEKLRPLGELSESYIKEYTHIK